MTQQQPIQPPPVSPRQSAASNPETPVSSRQESANNNRQSGANTPAEREMILARFIRLCSSVLAASAPQEAAALTVNRISELVRVDRAVLVSLEEKKPIAAVTGGGAVAQDGSFADAVEAVRRQYGDMQNPALIPAEGGQFKSLPLRKVQQSMDGTAVLWLPLWLDKDPKIQPAHALWLERWRGIPWEKADVELLQHAALFLGHGIARQRGAARSKKGFLQTAFLVMLGIFLLFPVTSSVTAPVQVVPDLPHHIFAPMDGILKDLFVQPGQHVNPDTVLFQYDARVLEKRLDEAYRNVAVAKATLARLEGKAHRDPEARAELPVKQLEVERAEAEADFFANQLARSQVRTAKSGVIVLDDPDALIGASIRTGQVILSVADPSRTKLRVMVPASDAGLLKEGARVKIRLDSNPLRTVSALITRVGFEIKLSEDQVPSVLAEAVWSEKIVKVQPGQKGSAKIFGSSTLLGIQLLRKPLVKFRNFIGI